MLILFISMESNNTIASPPKRSYRLVTFFTLILTVFLAALALFLYTRISGISTKNQAYQEYLNKLNELQGEISGFAYRAGEPILEARMGFIIFVSTGEVEKREIAAKDGEIAEVHTVTGISKNVKDNPVKVEVVVQAVLRNEGEDVFSFLLEKFVNDRGLNFGVDKETLLSEKRLKEVFSPGTTVWVSFWILPLDLDSPVLDPEGSWVKLHNLAEKSGNIDINSLNEFINSELRSDYKKIIIPSSYAFLDNP